MQWLRLFYSIMNVNYFNNTLYSFISKVLRYLLVEHGNLGMHIVVKRGPGPGYSRPGTWTATVTTTCKPHFRQSERRKQSNKSYYHQLIVLQLELLPAHRRDLPHTSGEDFSLYS